jgi:hypothetical protein
MYKPGREALEETKKMLKPKGINLSSEFTCALSVACLAHLGPEAPGMGLLIEYDEINDLEADLHAARPKWCAAKMDSKDASSSVSN